MALTARLKSYVRRCLKLLYTYCLHNSERSHLGTCFRYFSASLVVRRCDSTTADLLRRQLVGLGRLLRLLQVLPRSERRNQSRLHAASHWEDHSTQFC